MAYVAPSTVTTLQTYTSAAHNIIVNDIIDHETRIASLKVPPSASVLRSTDLTPYTTGTVITWQSARYDTDSMWSAGAPTRLTVNTPGIYLITFYVYVAAVATMTHIQPDILIDGNQFQTNFFPSTNSTTAYEGVSATASLTAGQFIGGSVYFNSGSSHVIKGSASYGGTQTRLTATLLGATS